MNRSGKRMTARQPIERFVDFHRNRSGQVSFLTVFGAVALAGLLGLVMTTGDQATLKIRTQNAADAAALSGGAWIARGLNVTSAANVAQTQLVAGAILLDAFHRTLTTSLPGMKVQRQVFILCSSTPIIGAFCILAATIVNAQITAVEFLIKRIGPLIPRLARCPDGLFWRVAKLLESVNEVVRTTFFAVALGETLRVAQVNGAESAALIPGPIFHGAVSSSTATLPTQRVEFPALCPAMTDGSPDLVTHGYGQLLGYPLTQGPFKLGRCRLGWITIATTGLPPIGAFLFPWYADRTRRDLCGEPPEPGENEFRRPAESLEECRRLGGTATWRVVDVTSGPVPQSDGCRWLAEERACQEQQHGPPAPAPAGAGSATFSEQVRRADLPCGDSPPGEPLEEMLYCSTGSSEPAAEGLYRHVLETWVLEGAWVKDGVLETDPGGGCSAAVKPRPYVLRDEPDALRYLAVAHRPNRRIFFPSRFLEEPPNLVTYAQVEIYNGVSEDTFTQDWRVRLERASLLEQPLRGLGRSHLFTAMNHLLAPLGLDPAGLAAAVRYLNHH